jgi:hypothetical protein
MDKSIEQGFNWLIKYILINWKNLKARIENDTSMQKSIELKRRERIAKKKDE